MDGCGVVSGTPSPTVSSPRWSPAPDLSSSVVAGGGCAEEALSPAAAVLGREMSCAGDS